MSLLSVRNISVSFGGIHALSDISFDVPEGVVWGLIGPNGAGKTTLVNILSGLIRPTAGSIAFDGHEDGPWSMSRAVEIGIARTFQQTRAFNGLTVRENLRVAAVAGAGHALDLGIARRLGLEDSLDRVAGELPYALLRRLGVALALSLKPRLILLDEPAVGLTADEIDRMGALIRSMTADGVTVLLIEHNVRFLMSIADRVSVLDRGRLLFEGTPAECQRNPQVIDVYLGRGGEDA
ncbi:ABC transporter ATP-binding protein [Paralimibaculum aggregatum]|uniref:ABC transporter ATP-binding protein n=1 Tax=Paralimibaculum aggregatum TaxID=3036245 RepID=A0ABQ6LTJ7_9RHOB|nr:ABC transporter ATP-binding protein [Limibaculum sp. NKW23]GMG85394.1 ABC transporter ATP-binding protein [Limibaculum sp. NKW23]